MKKVLRILIICSGILFAKKSFAQTEDYFSNYKQRIKLLIQNKEYDSIIAFSYYQFLDPPPPPPLTPPKVEILNNRSHYDNAFLICFKNDSCFAICIAKYDDGIGISNRILIEDNQAIDSLRQCWSKVADEYFAPFIYKQKKNGKVRYNNLSYMFPAHGNLSFRNHYGYETKDFLPFVTLKSDGENENMNYKYNSSLHLFTVYTILKRFYRSLYKQFIYHE